MFNTFCRSVFLVQRPASRISAARGLHRTSVLLKKHKDVSKQDNSSSGADLKHTEQQLQTIIDKFVKKANEIKMGKTSPSLFDHIQVSINGTPTDYVSLAQTSIKGRNMIITVFDPANTQKIHNAIIEADLNVNPVADTSSKQVLKVPLPPITAETKKDDAKLLKAAFEKAKVSPKGSFNAIRAEFKKPFQKQIKAKKLTDEEKTQLDDFEKLHKKYTDKLTSEFEKIEKAILK